MKEEDLEKLFEKIRQEKPETSPEQIAEWLRPDPAVTDIPVSSEIVKYTLFTSKNIIIMSILAITFIIGALMLNENSDGKTNTPAIPETVIPYQSEATETSEILNRETIDIIAPFEFSASENSVAPDEETTHDLPAGHKPAVKREVTETTRLEIGNNQVYRKNDKIDLSLTSPTESSLPKDKSNTVSLDTIFSNVDAIEIKCESCNSVRIKTHKDKNVHFQSDITIGNKSKLKKEETPKFTFEQKGKTLIVTYKSQEKKINIGKDFVRKTVEVQLTVPGNVNIKSEISYGNLTIDGINNDYCQTLTSSGNLMISNSSSAAFDLATTYGNQQYSNISGAMKVRAVSGNIRMENIKGNVSIGNTYGSINISKIDGNLNANGSSSNINVKDINGNSELKTTYGSVNIDGARGNAAISASSGNLKVNELTGALNSLNTYGSMHFSNIAGPVNSTGKSTNLKLDNILGEINVSNTYGNVSMKNTSGNVNIVNTSGNVEGIDVLLRDKMNITVSYGNIKMKLNNASGDLSYDLSTSRGNIRINPLNINSDKNIIEGSGPVKISTNTVSGNQIFE